jgi:hypothetical protein
MIINRQKDALPCSISTHQLGQAMSQLDLSSVPPEKRKAALMDHFMRIAAASIHDRDKAAEIAASRQLRRQRGISAPYKVKRL